MAHSYILFQISKLFCGCDERGIFVGLFLQLKEL